MTAQKDIAGLRVLKTLYGSEDLLLKRLRPAENMKAEDLTHQINQLQSIIDKNRNITGLQKFIIISADV